jgi:general secretion pathway protein M
VIAGVKTLPEGRQGQILAVGIAAVALALLWLGAVSPLLGWYASQADALQSARLELAHVQALQASLPVLRAQLAASAALPASDAVLLEGTSDAIAGANLQAQLSTLAGQAGTSLDSAESIPAQQVGGLRRIGVSVSVTATWPVLTAFLTAIDAAQPRMIVDNLAVTAESQIDPRQDATLQANFDVAAFRAGTAP